MITAMLIVLQLNNSKITVPQFTYKASLLGSIFLKADLLSNPLARVFLFSSQMSASIIITASHNTVQQHLLECTLPQSGNAEYVTPTTYTQNQYVHHCFNNTSMNNSVLSRTEKCEYKSPPLSWLYFVISDWLSSSSDDRPSWCPVILLLSLNSLLLVLKVHSNLLISQY